MPSHEGVSLGEWLKQRRKELGLTQEELATRLGCSVIAISKIEAGSRHPSRQLAELIADLFKVPDADREAFVNFARGLLDHPARQQEIAEVSLPGERQRGNLPSPITRLMGQEDAVTALAGMLTRDAGRDRTRLRTPHARYLRRALPSLENRAIDCYSPTR